MRGLVRIALAGSVLLAVAPLAPALAGDQPLVSLTPKQEKELAEVYFNCDHEGTLGCLIADCKARGADRAEVRYLYRDVSQNFPELLTPDLRACFIRAGGKFR